MINWIKKIFKPANIVDATYDEKTQTMTVNFSDGETVKYYGSSTVWFIMPYMVRCGSSKESKLSEIYQYIKVHGNPYPTAHKPHSPKK